MDPANDPYMQTANLTCRVALVTAAALASEEASSSTAQEAVLAAAEGTDAHLPRQPHLLDPSTPLTSEMANYIARAGGTNLLAWPNMCCGGEDGVTHMYCKVITGTCARPALVILL